jgi:hypothetical protein
MNSIEEKLWNYIDGNCTPAEQQAIGLYTPCLLLTGVPATAMQPVLVCPMLNSL